MEKTCCTCKITKPFSEFGTLESSKDGLPRRCKACSRAAIKASKHKHYVPHPKRKMSPELRKVKDKEKYWKNREKYLANASLYQKMNKERTNAKNKAWLDAHPEKKQQYYQAAKARNPEKLTAQRRAWHIAHPWIKAESVAQRRARKKNATPKWANPFFMREAYHLARLRTAATGFKWHVDHIYPLQSPAVCGLHVEQNLQVIPALVNQRKYNKVIHHG